MLHVQTSAKLNVSNFPQLLDDISTNHESPLYWNSYISATVQN